MFHTHILDMYSLKMTRRKSKNMLQFKFQCFNCRIICYNTVHFVGVVLCNYFKCAPPPTLYKGCTI
jgi:hypothetical protein